MANDFIMTSNTSVQKWDLNYIVDQSGIKTKRLNTQGTFVDRPIDVSVETTTAVGAWQSNTITKAQAKANIGFTNGLVTTTSVPSGTNGTNYWTITPFLEVANAGSYQASFKFTKAGWQTASTLIDTSKSIQITELNAPVYYIPKATYTATNNIISVAGGGYSPVGSEVIRMATATPSFSGGGLTINSTVTSTNIVFSSNNVSGISLASIGIASRDNVIYSATVNGYVCQNKNTVALAGSGETIQSNNFQYKYISSLTLPKTGTLTVNMQADTTTHSAYNLNINNSAYRIVNITNPNNGLIELINNGTANIANTKTISVTANSGTINIQNSNIVNINNYKDINIDQKSSTTGNIFIKAQGTPSSVSNIEVVHNGRWTTTAVVPSLSSQIGPFYGETYVYPISSGSKAATTAMGGALSSINSVSGAISNGFYNGSTTISTDKLNITTSMPAGGGYLFTAFGYGQIQRATAQYKVVTNGYADSTNNITVNAITANSNTASTSYYIKKSILSTTSCNSSGTTTQTLQIPEGYYPSDRYITVNPLNQTTVTTEIKQNNLYTYFTTATNATQSISLQPSYSNATAGYLAVHTGTAGDGTVQYFKIKTTSFDSNANGFVSLNSDSTNSTISIGSLAGTTAGNLTLLDTAPTGSYYSLQANATAVARAIGWGEQKVISNGWITTAQNGTQSKTSSTATTYLNLSKTYYVKESNIEKNVINAEPSTDTGRTSGTYEDIEIQPAGYVKLLPGYYAKTRYIYANRANEPQEAVTASNFSVIIPNVSGTAIVGIDTSSLNNGYYNVSVNNLTVGTQFQAGTPGWFSYGEASGEKTSESTIGKIKKGEVRGTITATAGSYTTTPSSVNILGNSSASVSGKTKIDITPVTTTNSITTYYIPIQGIANATLADVNLNTILTSTTATITATAGYIPDGVVSNNITIGGTVNITSATKISSNYYIPLPTAAISYNNTATALVKVTPQLNYTNGLNILSSAPAGAVGTDYWTLTPFGDGSVAGTIKFSITATTAGWIPKNWNTTTSISVQNISWQTGTSKYLPKAKIYTNNNVISVTAAGYLPTGNIATIGAGNISSGTGTFSFSDTPVYNNNTFNITATAVINAPIVNTAGYISDTIGTKNGNNFSGVKSIGMIGLKTTYSGNTNITPSLRRVAKSSGSWTDAFTGSITTTLPTSGVYVCANTVPGNTTLTINPAVYQAGYGTSDHATTTSQNVTVTSATATATYFPVKVGSITAQNGVATLVTTGTGNIGGVSGVLTAKTTAPTSGYYISFTGKGNVQISSSGWINETMVSSNTETKYYQIQTTTAAIGISSTIAPSLTASNVVFTTTGNGISIRGLITGSMSMTATSKKAGYTPNNIALASAAKAFSEDYADTYLQEVKLQAPSSGNRQFGIWLPNGSTTEYIKFVFHVDSAGNVFIDNKYTWET